MSREEITERPRPWRRRFLLAMWFGGAAVICTRAAQVQVLEGASWREVAEAQHKSDQAIAAERGTVLDRDGIPLAVTRERFRISIAPNELSNPAATQVLLSEVTGISSAKAAQLTAPDRRWSVVAGTYPPSVREQLIGVHGIHIDRELQRYHPHGDLARGALGVVLDGAGRGGIEEAFEDLLSGTPGREVFARDNRGNEIPGERLTVQPQERGGEVVLTLDMDLQEIARQALEEAIADNEARGGDVLVTDPKTGEILALVSIRDGQTAGLSAINTAYEPGSTLKPFTVAGLLERGLVSLADTVDGENGSWRIAGRTLHDIHGEGRITIGDALRVSSNIGIAKAALPMEPGDQYENLRDFGFGSQTGIEIPGESSGSLSRPDQWSGQSAASLAIGYEIGVTPLQMAMAYGALANGGELMEPRLVREIRAPNGSVIERFEPRVLRRVVSTRVANAVNRVLVDVVEDGTGKSARIGTFTVAGKSGTTRLYEPGIGYEPGAYWSSFVGFFPAEDPQLVVFVKLERPSKGGYYGGAIAAPVTRTTMEAALAARATPLDRAALLRTVRTPARMPLPSNVRFATQPIDPPAPPIVDLLGDDLRMDRLGENVAVGSFASTSDEDFAAASRESPLARTVPVPDVSGLASRVAVRRLHALGLRVSRQEVGSIVGTVPAAGSRALPGDTVRLVVRRRSDG